MDASVVYVLRVRHDDLQLCRFDGVGERNVSEGTLAVGDCRLHGPARAIECLHRIIQHPAIHAGEEKDASENDGRKSLDREDVW